MHATYLKLICKGGICNIWLIAIINEEIILKGMNIGMYEIEILAFMIMYLMRQNKGSGSGKYLYTIEFVLWCMYMYRQMSGQADRTNDWRGRTNEGTREAKWNITAKLGMLYTAEKVQAGNIDRQAHWRGMLAWKSNHIFFI